MQTHPYCMTLQPSSHWKVKHLVDFVKYKSYKSSGTVAFLYYFSHPDPPSCQLLLLLLSDFIMQQAMLKEQTGGHASFLLVQLWRASVCKASEGFSLQQ